MKRTTKAIATGLLALATHTSAQVASVCQGSVCFKLNIPESTASSGNGDVFFQLSAPTSYEYVALGLGSRMSGSNMFVVYTSGSGNNVTLSPRSASGYSMPTFNGDMQVTLLEGSGVSGGNMIANIRCSNCGSAADFTGDNGNFIYGVRSSGGPKNSDDTNARIAQHDDHNSFQWSFANAKGGDSVNPLLNTQPSGTGSGGGGGAATSCVPRPVNTGSSPATAAPTATNGNQPSTTQRLGPPTWRSEWGPSPTASPTGRRWGPPDNEKRQEINYCDDTNGQITPIGGGLSGSPLAQYEKKLIAHGVLAALAFVILFPAGAIAIRLASFPGVVWFHAGFQAFAYLVYIAAFGLGVYLANEFDMLDHHHPIIGIVVFVLLFLQPIFGLLHHSLYKRYQTRTFWSYAHLWIGRIAITLGIINGGFGFQLADTMNLSSRPGMIAYAVIAALVWLAWVAAIVIGERRRKTATLNRPPKYSETESPRGRGSETRDIPHPHDGHYAPGRRASTSA